MSLSEEKWFQRIMQSEGGLNLKEPESVGGKSYGGISQKALGDWREKRCQITDAPYQVEDLAGTATGTEHENKNPFDIPVGFSVRCDVIEAFYTDYFKNAHLELLPECLKYMHADFFVNAGYGANKILQRMIGFVDENDVDGILGPASRAKISELKAGIEADLADNPTADDDAITEYHSLKLEHYEAINDRNHDLYEANIKGWRKRAQHVLSELGEYFEDEEPTTSAVLDESDHESVFEDQEQEDQEELIERISDTVVTQLLKKLPSYITEALKNK